MTARQCMTMFGEENFPEALRTALDQQSETTFDFLHHVGPNEKWEPGRIDRNGKPWTSEYVSMTGQCLLRRGGYRSFPLATGRYSQIAPGEVYGRSVAMACLPSLKSL